MLCINLYLSEGKGGSSAGEKLLQQYRGLEYDWLYNLRGNYDRWGKRASKKSRKSAFTHVEVSLTSPRKKRS